MDKVMGYMFQHEDTGVSFFVDLQQIEWGFEKNNPRHIKGPAVHSPKYFKSLQERIEELEKILIDKANKGREDFLTPEDLDEMDKMARGDSK